MKQNTPERSSFLLDRRRRTNKSSCAGCAGGEKAQTSTEAQNGHSASVFLYEKPNYTYFQQTNRENRYFFGDMSEAKFCFNITDNFNEF